MENLKFYGWIHWEGDVIHLVNETEYNMSIDCSMENGYIRIFNNRGFEFSDFIISNLTIKSKIHIMGIK